MAERIRVGVLGLTHDHIWGNLEALAQSEQGVLVAAADLHPELRQEVTQKYPDTQVFDFYSELLDQVKLDAVYIYADNRTSAELTEMAAARGLHVMVEKPMASTLAAADRMRRAAHAARVQLMVNWPNAWSPALQQAFRLIQEGRIGDVFQVNYRSAHAGPRELGCSPFFSEWLYDPRLNGAGALMDYCCYGAAMACLLLGRPSRVTAVSGRLRKIDLPAEDNAVLIMQHAAAISTATASWTQIGHLTSYVPMFYGSAGTLVVQGKQLLLATNEHEDGEPVDVPPPPADERNSAEFFLSHIRSGKPIEGLCSPEVSLLAQEVLEAGLRSVEQGCSVPLPLPISHYVNDGV
jgi:predicted dehydrogenase